jgi:hypothetical protein
MICICHRFQQAGRGRRKLLFSRSSLLRLSRGAMILWLLALLCGGTRRGAAVQAQVVEPARPEKVTVLIRYQILAERNDRILQYRALMKYLESIGFVDDRPNEMERAEDALDPAAHRLQGTICGGISGMNQPGGSGVRQPVRICLDLWRMLHRFFGWKFYLPAKSDNELHRRLSKVPRSVGPLSCGHVWRMSLRPSNLCVWKSCSLCPWRPARGSSRIFWMPITPVPCQVPRIQACVWGWPLWKASSAMS